MAVMGRPVRSTYTSQRSRKPPKGRTTLPITGTFTSSFANLIASFSGTLGTDDWNARSTAPGVILANRLEDGSYLATPTHPVNATQWLLSNATSGNVSLDTTLKVNGALGSFKHSVPNTAVAAAGDVGVYFGNITSFGDGDTVWWSYRIRTDAVGAYQHWPTVSSAETGLKLSILSHSSGSNQVNEVVTQVNYLFGLISGYWQNGVVTAVQPDEAAITECSATDFKWQPEVDNGVSPLTGNDPDTGAAWSLCAQDRARYGGLYSAKTLGQSRYGFGDPLSGGFRYYPDEWITITCRLIIGTLGTASNRWTQWAARDGEEYVLLHDVSNIQLGAGPEYNTLWLLPYVTNRVAGGRSVDSRTTNITGAEILTVGNSTPLGTGTLEYTASTGRFRWRGLSETYGTARGYSEDNNILTLNVTSGTTTNSFVVVKVTPDDLPTSGTVTDSVVIADGRPDTQTNYNDVIISTAPINAPGGFPPPGVAPAYVVNATAGQWTQISTNSVTDVQFNGWGTGSYPSGGGINYDDVYGLWAGTAYDPSRQMLYFSAGGHSSYNGNDWYAFDLANNVWKRVNNPSPYLESQSVAGLLPDGLPQVIHTYGEIECDSDGYIYRLATGGSAISTIWRFDPNFSSTWPFAYNANTTTGPWRNTGASVNNYNGGFVWDSVSGRFYGGHVANTSNFWDSRYYEPATQTSGSYAMNGTGFGSGFAPGLDPAVALDTSRRLMYVVGGNQVDPGSPVGRGTVVYDIAAGSWSDLTSLTSGDKTPETYQGGGMTYDTRRDLMWWWDGTPTAKDLFTFDYTTKTWTKLTPSGSSPHTGFVQGTFNKIRYIEEYDVIVVCCGSTDTNTVQMWMYKPSDWLVS
jgi:hypothetical protein